MPLTKTNTPNPIRGIVHPNANQRQDCQHVINQIVFADMGRGAGTLHTFGSARLDLQGRTATGAVNLQVQIGSQTAAAALIDASVLHTTDPANQRGASNGAISVLQQDRHFNIKLNSSSCRKRRSCGECRSWNPLASG